MQKKLSVSPNTIHNKDSHDKKNKTENSIWLHKQSFHMKQLQVIIYLLIIKYLYLYQKIILLKTISFYQKKRKIPKNKFYLCRRSNKLKP